MRSTKITIAVLVLAFLASNLWWAYHAFDAGVTHAYLTDSLNDNRGALSQTLALLPVVARPGVSKSEVIAAARQTDLRAEPFEKDGFIWIGWIGLKFDDAGRVIEASRAWSPP
jgi:hypothetical protein